METTTTSNTFQKLINNVSTNSYVIQLKWFVKRGGLLIFSLGILGVLQIASLEITNRYRIFPLYGFYLMCLFVVVALSIYLVVSKRVVSLPAWRNIGRKPKQKKLEEIPAVLLIIRRTKIRTPKNNSVSV